MGWVPQGAPSWAAWGSWAACPNRCGPLKGSAWEIRWTAPASWVNWACNARTICAICTGLVGPEDTGGLPVAAGVTVGWVTWPWVGGACMGGEAPRSLVAGTGVTQLGRALLPRTMSAQEAGCM